MATYAGDTSSSAKTNYARLGHASQDLIPKLLQQLLLFYEPTYKIRKDCLLNSYLSNKCNAIEWNNICKANTDGYVDFDVPLIYKLLRNLKLIPKPTRGWEPQGGPMITETTIGDDLERFRKSRNEILHRGNANVSDEELTEYFTQFKDIAQRLELVLNKKKNELVSEFQNLETCCMDDVSEQILANLAKKEKDESPNEKSALIKKPLQDVCCVEGEIACLSCEIIEDETAVTWYKDDAEIIPSTDIILKMHGKIRELSIPRTEMKDGGRFSIKVKQSTSEAKLTVKALISNHLVDTTCLEGSTIVLSCEVSVEGMGSIWYKDDSIVVKSNQIYPTVNSRIHQLNIFQSEIKDGGKYVFKIRDKISSAILTVKAVITKHLENVTCIEDQSLSLVCELAEKDISVIWLKDEKVIEASKNIVPEIHNNAHILKFKKLSKNDGGKYALMAEGKKTEAVVLVKAKSTIPDQILQMDENDKVMYLEIIKSGTERRYYIRLMIVGENGVGKTCLMRRLLGEDIDDVTSTDGIDVVIRKCKIRISDGQWILNEEDTVKQDRNVRMKRALTDKDSILPEEKIRDKQAESLLEDAPMETTVTPFGNVKGEEIKNVTEIKDIYTGKVMDQKNDVDMQFTNELEEESIAESVPLHTDKDVTLKSEKRVGLLDSLSDVMNVELPKEFFADCDVWDFAGQKEFYATHQTFLTNSAIYLLTADLSKDLSSQIQTKICNVDFGKVGCYIDFWFDTIHCYATTESPDQSVDKPTSDKLEPPIIIVCTGTDKIEGELSKQKDFFVKQLNSILDKQSKRKHITGIQYISNKEPLEKDFVELQSAIVQTATKMSSWGKELPLRWIHLETALDGERDAGSNILPFHLVVKLAKDSSLPTSDNEEIILFLKYQHECGHVIFFKDLPDYIILNPRWLIDAFKCFVSAHQFQGDLLYLDDWKELEETGRLTNELISRLFEKVPKLKFMEYKEHLLHVLEKFDIIVKPNNIENTTSYYLPCMIKSSSFDVICHNFGVHLPSCHRTSWLLLEFEFLPPAFFNHVLVGYIRQFNVSTESTENGRRLSLYRGIGVFDIVEKGCTKLVICADTNLIAFQIWIYDKKINSTFHDFRHTLTNMVDMLSERYQICCKYKVKLKCSESDYQKAEGRYEYCYKDDKMKSYFCPEHQSGHGCLDVFKYWFSDKVDVDGLVIKEEEQGEEATQKVDMKTMKILTEVSNSIGMFVGKIQGSCWRAGTDLIVTAWHVVRYHISEYEDLNEIKLKEVKIKFDYTDSGACGDSNIFEVEPNILYCNETLDTAILRLKLNDKVVTFPPPFRRFDHFLVPAKDEHQKIYLIGHPDNLPQQVNLGVGLWNPTKERMQSLATFCKNEKYDYGYAELDKTERLVIKCEFECGASGCPGVVILDDNQVYLVTMFLKGFPDFYQSRLFNGEKKQKFPKSKLFQQGVNIGAIYDDLKKKSIYANIFEDIFIKQNPPVNMDPSAIIPSENYTDGSQDCHDRVSTSTRPTSDEGTHHVTSPCEEETNENVSTCTHPTTVERQGSQMVASANNINADTINMGGDGTNITVKNTDKKEQTNTSVGSSSSSSSENETPENFDKMEKGRHNSDCGQEPGDVDIIKEKISKMKPVSVTEQNNIYVSDIERIAVEHGFSVKNVRGDGNCMFHAIALQLLGNKLKSKIGEEKSKELRCNIVEFLKNNDTTPTGEKYSSFLSSVREDERESRWSTYLASMSKPGTYGDEIILRAVSHCFNVRIHVLSTASPERFIKYNSPDISEDSSTVYLGFIDEYLHYVRLQHKSSEGAACTGLLDDNASPFKEERAKQEDERMAEATTSRHESNYIKIAMVVLQVSSRAVRVQFDKEFHPVRLQSILKKDVVDLTNLKMKKRITQHQWNLLFPRTGEQPSSKDFDITLMICLLRNLIPIDIMDRLPLATDTSLGADLSRIKYYRNIIVHCDSPLIDDTDFESYWNDVTQAILRLGGNSLKVECDDWYGRNLDAKQRDDGLKSTKAEERLALVEELAETNKKQIELEQEKRKELVETIKKLIESEQEKCNPVPNNIRVPIIELKGHTFNVDEGKSVAIECNEFIIDEKRPPFWEWIREDDETNKLTIREDKKDKYLLKSDPPYLWIFNAEMSDRGYYRCCIEYSTSNGEEIVRSKKAHLIVEKAVKPGDIHTHIDKQVNIKANNINADTINMGGVGTNITVKNTDKKEQTNTFVGSSSSSSSENETPENFDKMEKGRHNSDCGQEPGDVDIIKEKMSKMKPVSVTEQGGDGTNITMKNSDKKEQTDTSVGSSSSSSSENETPENFDKMEKGRHNSDCGQEPGDVDIIKEKMSKMKPVSVTEQAEKRSALFEELAETNKKQIESKQETSKKLAEMNKKLIELEQEQSNPVPKNIEASLEFRTGAESQRSLDLDSDELELDDGNCDSHHGYREEPPSYQQQPPSYSINVDLDAEPTDQHSQQQPVSRFELDAVILHASHDEEEVKKCKELLERHAMSGNVRADVGFIDDVIFPGSYAFEGLCELLHKCRLVLVFHTKNFKKDGLIEYAKHIILKQAIQETDKQNRIIPIIADDEDLSCDLKLFVPVSYYDVNFLPKMSKLFTYWRNKLP